MRKVTNPIKTVNKSKRKNEKSKREKWKIWFETDDKSNLSLCFNRRVTIICLLSRQTWRNKYWEGKHICMYIPLIYVICQLWDQVNNKTVRFIQYFKTYLGSSCLLVLVLNLNLIEAILSYLKWSWRRKYFNFNFNWSYLKQSSRRKYFNFNINLSYLKYFWSSSCRKG